MKRFLLAAASVMVLASGSAGARDMALPGPAYQGDRGLEAAWQQYVGFVHYKGLEQAAKIPAYAKAHRELNTVFCNKGATRCIRSVTALSDEYHIMVLDGGNFDEKGRRVETTTRKICFFPLSTGKRPGVDMQDQGYCRMFESDQKLPLSTREERGA